jgi:hypothetical protein
MTSGAQLSESEWQSDCEYQHHHYLHYLHVVGCHLKHSSSSQEFVTVGINLGTVWLLFYYWPSKLINVLLFPSFPNSHHLPLIFPIIRDPSPRYKWVGKSLICNEQVGCKALCNKQVGLKTFVIGKSFSSLLIGCVLRPIQTKGVRV